MSCLSVAIASPKDHLNRAMDVNAEENLTQLQVIHYWVLEKALGTWRARTYTDVSCPTLLFQRDEDDGLEVMHGWESCESTTIGGYFLPINT